ncbi:MAG: class I SAM-dependent DNA methyltransferase [Verrucomicrobia bacterium]|nr:class I SAM-dependent DNA methyltransferase [Verrucomicrobiota bacterium]
MPDATPEQITAFIDRWEHSGAAERSNYVLFLSELCALLDLPRPDPSSPDNAQNGYVFERAITRKSLDGTTTTGFIDLYRRGSFVLESKQGTNAPGEENAFATTLVAPAASGKTGHGKRGTAAFDKALERAYHQARGYLTALSAEEGRPPFLIVCDIGHSLDIYAEFTGTGGQYERFPDPVSHRITLPDLHRPEIRERLRKIWLDPHSLDPSKFAAAVTRDIAGRLAVLAKSLESDGHDPQVIAGFLQRCLFTMFAEDVGLLPEDGFKTLLAHVKESPRGFPVLASALWKEMATGTRFSALLFKEIACFNGGLFENTTALPLSAAQLAMLTDAADKDWSAVEPSIFGTLLTRALDSRERHKLGAEYTPRAYVERLIRPTIIGPLRDEWDAVRVAAVTLHDEAHLAENQADQLQADATAKLTTGAPAEAKQLGAEAVRLRKESDKRHAEALQQVITFHRHLCKLRILDPACGTANFLYVTMEHMKRLEAEVLELIAALGGDAGMEMHGFRVRPEQFIGLELNQQAVAIAQLVLWIGYFQWQRKTTGKADTGDRPLLPKDKSIYEQDAVLAYDARIPRRDPQSGEILTVWNGYTTKPHPITGKEVPDESARRVLFDYTNPRRAEWPQADYITGNPPFIGASPMRDALGDGYVEALRKVWKGDVPESADFVMFWWRKAAELVRDGKAKRFGFITTNSIHQTFNRRVLERFLSDTKKPLHLAYAIPDHPWIDSANAAAVRIAMTVVAPGKSDGILENVITEQAREDGENEVSLVGVEGVIAPNLQIGADLTSGIPLRANSDLANHGVIRGGEGFLVPPDQLHLLGYGRRKGIEKHLRLILNGSDLTSRNRTNYVIDLFGLSESEVRENFPEIYQWVYTHVRPGRLNNKRTTRRDNWWLFNESVPKLRSMLVGLPRFISTSETAKHRVFVFIDGSVLPEHKLVNIAHADSAVLGVLSSFSHVTWTLAIGSQLGPTPVYVKTTCFETFPFPALEEGALKQRIRDLGERLDSHRKRQQEQHPDLTLTGIYNVLEKLRSGETLTAKDKEIHENGLVSILKQIHDDLDAAVLEAYGWQDLSRSVGVSPTSREKECGRDAHTPCADILARGGPDAEALEQQLLTRLVALNHERAAEEKRGLIRWLRPDYQAPGAATAPAAEQTEITLPDDEEATPSHGGPGRSALPAWPETMAEQVVAVRKLLTSVGHDAERLAACFGRKSQKRSAQITAILDTLRALGHII